jgi:ParB-like nuclease domain
VKILCQYHELVSVNVLKTICNPLNPNRHSPDQIVRLAAIMKSSGIRSPIVVSKLSMKITKGHGRLEAALLNDWKEFPVSYQEYESEEQEYADMVADNAIASWAELDLAAINLDVPDLGPDFDINLLGLKDFEIEPADKIDETEEKIDSTQFIVAVMHENEMAQASFFEEMQNRGFQCKLIS